jgi:WD40 repeat protein
LLAFTNYDQPPSVLDVATGEVIWELAEPCRGGVTISPDGKILVCSGTDKGVYQFDVESRSKRKVIEGADERASGRISFSRDGTLLLTPCGSAGAYVWDLAAGKPLQHVKHGEHYVRSAEFSPDGEWIITGGYDGTARIWNAKTGDSRARLTGMSGVYGLAISLDGKLLIIAARKQLLLFELWLSPPRAEDIEQAQERLTALESDSYAKRQSASEGLVALGFRAESILQHAAENSPDAEVRIRARLARQRILSEPTATLRGHASDINGVCISPDSQTIASASDDGTVRLWDVNSNKEVAQFRARPPEPATK